MIIRIDLVDLFLEYTEARIKTSLSDDKASFKAPPLKTTISIKRVRIVDDLLFKRDNGQIPEKTDNLKHSDTDLSARQSLTSDRREVDHLPYLYSKRPASETIAERPEVCKKPVFRENTEEDEIQTPEKESRKQDQ